jgi:hypothetical protein
VTVWTTVRLEEDHADGEDDTDDAGEPLAVQPGHPPRAVASPTAAAGGVRHASALLTN